MDMARGDCRKARAQKSACHSERSEESRKLCPAWLVRFFASLRMTNFLLIDNSNSFTKFALASRDRLLKFSKIATLELTAHTFATATRGWRFDAAVVSSVVPEKGKLLAHLLEKKSRVLRVGAGVR